MNSKYKYGTPEYKIEDAIKKMEEALESVENFRVEAGSVQKIEPISVGYYIDISSYFPRSFSSFDKKNKDHIEKCCLAAKEKYENGKKKIEEIHEKNKPALENNVLVRKSISAFMSKFGIEYKHSVYDYKTPRHKNKCWIENTSGYVKDMQRCVPISDGYEAALIKLKEFLNRINDWRESLIKDIEKAEKQKADEDKRMRKLAKALELARQYGITEDMYETNEELFKLVDDRGKEEFLANHGHELRDGRSVCKHYVDGDFITGYSISY